MSAFYLDGCGLICTVLTIVGPPVLNADTSMSFIFQVACAQLCNKRSGVGGFSLIIFHVM